MPRRPGFRADPFYYRNPLIRIDGRTKEGILVNGTINTLTEQLERVPTASERMLIRRLAIINLRLHELDQKILDGSIDLREAPFVTSLANSFQRGLIALGLLQGQTRLGGRPSKPLRPVATSIADLLKGERAA